MNKHATLDTNCNTVVPIQV